MIYDRKELLEQEFYSDDGKWTYEYLIRKGNNRSMVIWAKDRHDI